MLNIFNPRQTALISTRAEQDILGKKIIKDNLLAIDWHMPVSFTPMTYAISIDKNCFTKKQIEKSNVFTVNFMPITKKDQVRYCGRYNGEYIDKFKKTGLSKVESSKIECCNIKEAIAWLECNVIEEKTIGDHIIYIGEVVSIQTNKKGKRLFHTQTGNFTTTK